MTRLKIVSGGQTGVDRAALDVGLTLGLAVGGGCPQGRRAEDGRIPDRYPLVETPERNYEARTRRNVEDSDGTLRFRRDADSQSGPPGWWHRLNRCSCPPDRQAVSGGGAGGRY